MGEERPAAVKGRFGTIIWWVGVLSTVALIATLVQGFEVKGPHRLKPHLFLALASTLVIFFSHVWIAIYLWILRREVRQHLAGSGGPKVPGAALGWVGAALALVLGAFFLGPVSLQGSLPMAAHSVAGYFALALQLAALWTERRDLAAADRILAGLYAAEG